MLRIAIEKSSPAASTIVPPSAVILPVLRMLSDIGVTPAIGSAAAFAELTFTTTSLPGWPSSISSPAASTVLPCGLLTKPAFKICLPTRATFSAVIVPQLATIPFPPVNL
jgi:hypothetical protein